MNTANKKSSVLRWIDARFPLSDMIQSHASAYFVPKNFNIWYFFGVFSLIVLINQILTGIWLAMYYTPTAKEAFRSVEHVMRDVPFGWLFRYMHSTGASAFFIVVYLHMYRGIMYGSSKKPRELVWLIGMIIFATLVIESVSGYVLPWGQMSYWATKVLVTVFTAIPVVGQDIATWLQGDYNVSGVTLHRFFAFHVVAFPLLLIFLTGLHILALHHVGSNNPDGIDIKKQTDADGKPLDGIPFHPYYTVKDFMGVVVFLIVFALIVFFAPMMGGYFLEHANFAPSNPLVTPAHIAPPWYMAPFYSMLRAIPNKLLGISIGASAVAILFVLPWLDRSPVRSIRYKGIYSKIALVVLVVSFVGLGYLGTLPLSPTRILASRLLMGGYFLVFLLMPLYTRFEKTKPLPERVRMKEPE